MPLLAKAVVMWLVLLVVMFANGTFRVLVLQPRLGEDLARQVACLPGMALILGLTWVFLDRVGGEPDARALLAVGLLWLALTVAFEFLFGHYVAGASWRSLLADYDLRRGRLWPLVLLTVLVAPWLLGALRRGGLRQTTGE
jgi:hypothetical protein